MLVSIAQESLPNDNWVDKNAAAKLLGISIHTLKTYRKQHWILGIHF